MIKTDTEEGRIEKITREELMIATKAIKSGKAAGPLKYVKR